MKIALSAETTIDLSPELIKQYNINIVPFTVSLGERNDDDGVITPEEIFAYVDKTGVLPKTSAVNEYRYRDHFKKLLKEHDAIIHISLSSEISSSYANASKVSESMENVYVIDSRTLSTGIALLAIYTRLLIDKGLEPTKIVEKVKARIPSLQVSFVVNTLKYLYKGGRCTGLQRLGAVLLRLKPQIVLKDGKMQPGKKYIGKSSLVVRNYCDDTLKEFRHPDLDIVFVTHTHASPEMVAVAKEALQKRGFKNIYETCAGATITSHCGPKTLGILYFNDGGVKE